MEKNTRVFVWLYNAFKVKKKAKETLTLKHWHLRQGYC